jgi:histone H3/H4
MTDAIQPEELATIPEEAPRRRAKRRRPDLSDTVPAIPVAAFQRLVREITHDIKPDMRWEADALEALQVDAEAYLLQNFHDSNQIRSLCKSKTLNWDHWRQGLRTLEG